MSTRDKDCTSTVSVLIVLLCLFPPEYCYAIDTISPSQPLSLGQTLVSPRNAFELGFFTPKNSSNQYIGIWFVGVFPQAVVWIANRENPINITTGSRPSLTIGSRGNLELLDTNSNLVWSTDAKVSSNSSVAMLLDNGNFVLKGNESGDQFLWQSFDHLGDAFLPGSVLGFNRKTGDKYELTSWRSENDPSPGEYVVGISSQQRPAQAFVWINHTIPHWRSGPWDKSRFTGIVDMNTYYQSPFNLVEDVNKGTTYFHFDVYDNSTVGYMFVSSLGALRLMLKDQGTTNWFINWDSQENLCDMYGFCGPFAVCYGLKHPICKCLKGFVPKSSQDWSKGKWEGGCTRRTELLLCDGRNSSKKDGFGMIANVKPPDFYEFADLDLTDYDSCGELCLNNCSCLAYASVEGIGCLVWSQGLVDIQRFSNGGQELFFRLARKELVGGHRSKKIMISLVVVFTFGILGVTAFVLFRWRATLEGNVMESRGDIDLIHPHDGPKSDTFQVSKQHDRGELPIFDFDVILVATNQFSLENKLGQGGFGAVYKGIMPDGTEVAVKRLSSSSGQGAEEFKNEMILISKLQHRNLARVLGYCVEKEEKLLVYEFMPNKSLDYFIFDPRRSGELDWASRLNIIHGIARGLVYLHRDSCLRVIHRDLKVSNILLDEKMNPKISDFGLARIFQGTLDLANTQRVVGTLGYMSLEYAMAGVFSEKSDVFSFGVLTLEIVSGKKNTNFRHRDQQQSLIGYAWELWSESRELELADEALADSYSSSEVSRCIHIGLLCVQDHAADRPSMSDVVMMLSNEINRPRPIQPVFTQQSSPRRDFHSQSEGRCSVNKATMSLIEGR